VGDHGLGLFLCEYHLRWLQYSAGAIEKVWYEAAKTGLRLGYGKKKMSLCGESWLC
jgi:hypothetical protein